MQSVSVIICVYNSLPVFARCMEGLIRTTRSKDVEIVLVDNHSPDPEVRKALKNYRDIARVFDPVENLGCHNGWNFGFRHCNGEYVVKLDDDTVIQTEGWESLMCQGLQARPDIAYLSADIDAKQANRYRLERTVYGRYSLPYEIAENGIVGFSCVMFRRSDIERWGPMSTGAYLGPTDPATGKRPTFAGTDRLYGGEEVYYARLARAECRLIAHFPAVFCHHLGNEERHPDYPQWKWSYGFMGWTSDAMPAWMEKGQPATDYRRRLAWELRQPVPNDCHVLYCVQRLSAWGGLEDVSGLQFVRDHSANVVVQEACAETITKLQGKQ